MAQLMSRDGSLASLLTQARAQMLVIEWPSHTVTLGNKHYNQILTIFGYGLNKEYKALHHTWPKP